MYVVCCVCHRIQKGDNWVDEPFPSRELPSHGYCPDCAAVARIQLALMRLKDSERRRSEKHVA